MSVQKADKTKRIVNIESLWSEMADHLQAALTTIEVALLTGSVEPLPGAQREIMAAWSSFTTAAEPLLPAGDAGETCVKKAGDLLNRALLVGLVLLGAAAFLAGREAVGRHYDYREMTAPKSLHQLQLETRTADADDRGHLMVYGAGLFALALLSAGGMLFAMNGGKRWDRRRRRTARPAADALPAARSLPRAPILPTLPIAEGHYDEEPR